MDNLTTKNIHFYHRCCDGFQKCGFTVAKSLIYSYGSELLNLSDLPLDTRKIIIDILLDEDKINKSADSLDIQIYKIDIELLVCMLEGSIKKFIDHMKAEKTLKQTNIQS